MKQTDFKFSSDFQSLIEKVDVCGLELISRRTLFVASSRLTQKLDTIPGFFEALLTLGSQLDAEKDVLITAGGTTCDRFVRRIGELFSIPLLTLKVTRTPAEFSKLAARLGLNEVLVLAQPKVGVDELLATLADQMVVLSLRPKGNLEQVVLSRLDHGKSARMLVSESLTKRSLSDMVLDAGARGWYLFAGDSPEVGAEAPRIRFLSPEAIDSNEFLLHWTRRRSGPWPDQSLSRYLDELIFGCSEKERGELAVLRRMLSTGTILASNDLTRDPRRVVCFSDVSFSELAQRRVFRPHLSRWNFEPFGVAIRKSWLQEQGARPVVYGDEARWDSLADDERPFFQLNREFAKVDWSQEEEWRIVGDLDLRKVPVGMGAVFVSTLTDANQIAAFSRWPVVVLEEQA